MKLLLLVIGFSVKFSSIAALDAGNPTLEISDQRQALDNFEQKISNDNLGIWMRSLMADFDSQEDNFYRDFDGSIQAIYKVMLKSADSSPKLENLLFLTREDGDKYCADHFNNGTLLTINSAQESVQIVDWLFHKLRIPAKVWLGATKIRRIERRHRKPYRVMDYFTSEPAPLFLWDDNSGLVGFANWHSGTEGACEPNDNRENENCIEMLSNYYPYPVQCDTEAVAGQWNDIPCDTNIKNVIVCKKNV